MVNAILIFSFKSIALLIILRCSGFRPLSLSAREVNDIGKANDIGGAMHQRKSVDRMVVFRKLAPAFVQRAFLFFLFIFTFVLVGGWDAGSALGQSANGPNIVLINLDDADWELFSDQLMPRFPAIQRLATEGMTFTNMHATTPFCGPSRACLVRGQYAHRTGIKVNDPTSSLSLGFAGGYDEFLRHGYDQDEIGYWMKNAGYRTMFVGKYHHHGYFGPELPPGWDLSLIHI